MNSVLIIWGGGDVYYRNRPAFTDSEIAVIGYEGLGKLTNLLVRVKRNVKPYIRMEVGFHNLPKLEIRLLTELHREVDMG
ncbi:hypothetical protein BGX38DRAFT_1275452 [Terfezia claveryi]|nr:hypothetical protein BGX38DRAFT_1275452 [Terfezia claveryi]